MADNPEYQFKKLNDLLCTSFTNVKQDIRDINARFDSLRSNFSDFSTESIKTAFQEQTRLILEQQKAINQLTDKVFELESRKPQVVERVVTQAVPDEKTFKNKESALLEVKKLIKEEAKLGKTRDEKSVYDIPEGEVRITRTVFKPEGRKGKKKPTDEWVEVTGYGVDMSGWKLWDKGRKHVFKFPEGFTIYGPVKIVTGKGRSTNTKIFWGQPRPVWNDSGDVATLANKRGKIVSQVMSEPTYSFNVLK